MRAGLPAAQGRGFDRLPPEELRRFMPAIARSIDEGELRRAFHAVIEVLLDEIERSDAALANRLAGPLRELAA